MPMIGQFNASNNALIFESGTPEVPAPNVGPIGSIKEAGYSLNSTLNPAGVLVSLYYAMGGVDYVEPSSEPGWYTAGVAPIIYSVYVSACVLDVWTVDVSYSAPLNGTPIYKLASEKTHSDFNTTSALLGALDPAYSATFAAHLAASLETSLNYTADIFSTILAGNVSQNILAYASPLTERADSQSGNAIHSRTVSRYPFAPLGMVLGLSYLYALLALCVGLAAFAQPSRETIDLLYMRLTSARACIGDHFTDKKNAFNLVQSSTEEHTEESEGTRRLGAGFVYSGTGAFGDSQVNQRKGRTFTVDMVENLYYRASTEYRHT